MSYAPGVLVAPSVTSSRQRSRSDVVMQRIDGRFDLLNLHRLNPQRYPHLLESVARGGNNSRYDILFAFPGETLHLAATNNFDFLLKLDEYWSKEQIPRDKSCVLPFRGGWFIYLSYELAAQIEPRLNLMPFPHTLPVAFATRIPAAVIYDHNLEHTWLVAEAHAQAALDQMLRDLRSAQMIMPQISCQAIINLQEESEQRYLNAVRRIKRYILDGDVFQVNLSRLWQGELKVESDYIDIYKSLRCNNPAPFAGLTTWGNTAILSSSPERLLRTYGDNIETRPIAGTRPRSMEVDKDQEYSRELMAHPKERAEHIMLIDLERNDLGRVCVPGTVRVDELMSLETYAHVHHIVSNVHGHKRRDVTPGQVIGAVFPGGTITGCPKVRCMEIISELEETGRGPYTGSIGYLNRDGDMDLNILIRTVVMEGAKFSFRAGAGIVADSEPVPELEETRAKARGMLFALMGNGGCV